MLATTKKLITTRRMDKLPPPPLIVRRVAAASAAAAAHHRCCSNRYPSRWSSSLSSLSSSSWRSSCVVSSSSSFSSFSPPKVVGVSNLNSLHHHGRHHGHCHCPFTTAATMMMTMTTTTMKTKTTNTMMNNTMTFPFSTTTTTTTTTASSQNDDDDDDDDNSLLLLNSPRESMSYDVLIVGAGPAGLAASIKLKQLCLENGKNLSVCVVEKGSEVGAHILSGNVFEPRALDELLPNWRIEYEEESSIGSSFPLTPVVHDSFQFLTSTKSYSIPNVLLPKELHNDGNYVFSLGQLCRYLSEVAESLGVEIYPGFAASEVLYEKGGGGGEGGEGGEVGENDDAVLGIATRDVGIGKDGKPKSTFERGVELRARQTLFAEGARGSCSEEIISKFQLREEQSRNDKNGGGGGGGDDDNKTVGFGGHPQTYGLGIKEVWEISNEKHVPGYVQHTLGWPLQSSITDLTFGGTFLYHMKPNLVHLGLVIGLDYKNPFINPYAEFQRFKTHETIKKILQGGECISYGARVLNEGGLHSIPKKLTFRGGMLLGCSAGFLNSVKIKGTHTAMKSGMIAAESVFEQLTTNTTTTAVAETGEIDENESIQEVSSYQNNIQNSWIYDELYKVRNCHASFQKYGFIPGLIYTGFVTHISKGREPWTISHVTQDSEMTEPKDKFKPIVYPPYDGIITFDLLTNLQKSGTYHEEDQPCHLRIKQNLLNVPKHISMQIYAAPEERFCPAGVYEYVDDNDGGNDENDGAAGGGGGGGEGEKKKKKLVINAQNCVHCKCCSIKMPHEYINWTVPEGGGGPQYQVM